VSEVVGKERQFLSEIDKDATSNVWAKLIDLTLVDEYILSDLQTQGYLVINHNSGGQMILRVTPAGRAYLEDLNRASAPWWRKAGRNIKGNVPSIVIAILTSLAMPLAVNWLSKMMGWN